MSTLGQDAPATRGVNVNVGARCTGYEGVSCQKLYTPYGIKIFDLWLDLYYTILYIHLIKLAIYTVEISLLV